MSRASYFRKFKLSLLRISLASCNDLKHRLSLLIKRTSFSDPGPQSARHSSCASGPGPQSAPGPRKLGVLWGDDTAETEPLTVVKRTSLSTRLEGATHLGGHMLGLGVLAH